MADMPVEKDSGSSWWKWLLALLLLVVLIWLFFEVFIDEGSETEDTEPTTEQLDPRNMERSNMETTNTASSGTTAAGGGLITSIATLVNAENPQQMAGREVQISTMQVTSVLGDSAFYVTSQDIDRRFLIALDEVMPTPQDQTEGRYDVTEGQILDISGIVHARTGREPDAWGLTQEQAQAMQNDEIYLRAQKLTIVEEATSS